MFIGISKTKTKEVGNTHLPPTSP